MVSTALVLVGSVLGFGSIVCAAAGLLTIAVDAGDSVGFLIATWHDSSFWNEGASPQA
jgi:hypothetical protein